MAKSRFWISHWPFMVPAGCQIQSRLGSAGGILVHAWTVIPNSAGWTFSKSFGNRRTDRDQEKD